MRCPGGELAVRNVRILPAIADNHEKKRGAEPASLLHSSFGKSLVLFLNTGQNHRLLIACVVTTFNMSSNEDDPVVASYDIFLTDSDVSRYVFQYIDRPGKHPYNERMGQKPTALRMKPNTGMVEVDVPIFTRATYDVNKGLKYGDAMKKSRVARDGGAFGMAGGFSTGGMTSTGGRVKSEGNGDVEVMDNRKMVDSASLVRTQALGGRIKPQEEGDPVHMLAAFKGSE